jgi:hypothetical protein
MRLYVKSERFRESKSLGIKLSDAIFGAILCMIFFI